MASDPDNDEHDIETVVEQWRYTEKHPGFEGSVEFDLTFTMLGQAFTRRARVDYKFTPEWEFFDLHKKGLNKLLGGDQMSFSILCVPENFEGDPPSEEDLADGYTPEEPDPPSWEDFNLVIEGLLPNTVWEAVQDLVEATCKKEDIERRRKAGLLD